MIYLLFAIAAFMAIITASIINSMSKRNKNGKLNRAIVIFISFSIFVAIAIYLLQQKHY